MIAIIKYGNDDKRRAIEAALTTAGVATVDPGDFSAWPTISIRHPGAVQVMVRVEEGESVGVEKAAFERAGFVPDGPYDDGRRPNNTYVGATQEWRLASEARQ